MIIAKILLLSTLLSLSSGGEPTKNDLESLRVNYERAQFNKKVCQEMIRELSASTNSTVHMAYLGALQAVWAKHTLNPFIKIRSFKRGTERIEEAVRATPNNLEIRFLRYTIQANAPAFLGYNSSLDADRRILEANKEQIKSPALRKMINQVLGDKAEAK